MYEEWLMNMFENIGRKECCDENFMELGFCDTYRKKFQGY